jgi:cellulose synthase/poly-beta-1,6-N-acetylglucosamine synthase-like glycosyltransferase
MTARSDLVAFFHEDARTEPTWLAELVPVFNDKAVFGAGSAIELSCGEPPNPFICPATQPLSKNKEL